MVAVSWRGMNFPPKPLLVQPRGDLPGRKRGGMRWLLGAGLMMVVLGAYARALNGGFLWDDPAYISENPVLRTIGGLRAIWLDPSATCQYYPLSFTFFWTIYRFFGLNTVAYHLVNALLHGTAAILLWQVLERLRVQGAFLAGVIFALHPTNVMSVAWMTELKNVLSGSLMLGACWAYIRFAGLGVYQRAEAGIRPAWRWYAVSLLIFLLAMLAKTAVSFLPVTLLLILWWQRDRISGKDLLSLVPMLGISLGMGFLTIYIERHSGGASGPDFKIGFADRVLVSGRSFWFYLGKFVWPYPLTFFYDHWSLNAADWRQWIWPGATVAALWGAWAYRGRIGKGVFAALMHFYVSTSLLVLVVVLYMMRFTFVADHWQYFGSMSISALAAAGITRGLERLGGRELEICGGIGLGLALGVLTAAQCGMYSDIETFWETIIERNPQCWAAHNNLGLVYGTQGRSAEAMAQFETALVLKPDYDEAHFNLGIYLAQQGRTQEAITQYEAALRSNPDHAQARNNLGSALMLGRQAADAIAQYREALRIDPDYGDAHYNLGVVLFQEGKAQEAIAEFEAALRDGMDTADVRNNLGVAFYREGRTDEAIDQYQAAFRDDPTDAGACNNLGVALYKEGRTGEAIEQYEAALRLNAGYADAENNLGAALFKQGREAEAIAYEERALQLQPDDPGIENRLALMLSTATESSLRDGARAVDLASRASLAAGGNNEAFLRTLAAAYAQVGRYPDAVKTARRALDLAKAQADGGLAGALPREIALYQAGRPYEEAR
jgi:tetratricopeptide (TPR) repeat protein